MRTLLEIILAAGLIALGWEKPLREGFARTEPVAASQTTPSGAWMHDPNRRTILDTPPPNGVTIQPAPGSSPGSWMFDPNHRAPLDPPRKSARPTPEKR
jgi:hypothetical protein